ncbi:MAG: hypothetical protein V3S98_01100 [Dehalococcoidia bacterium]
MATPEREWQILGVDGMNRSDPTPFVRGANGSAWQMLEGVNGDVAEYPVWQGRLTFRDAKAAIATLWPRRKSST